MYMGPKKPLHFSTSFYGLNGLPSGYSPFFFFNLFFRQRDEMETYTVRVLYGCHFHHYLSKSGKRDPFPLLPN